MKRTLFISGFLLILLLGCGMEKFTGFITPPDIDSLMVRGWRYYDSVQFDKAEAAFDSVIAIDVSQLLALVGMGWVKLETNNYYDAKSFFSLTTTGEEASLITRVFNEKIPGNEITVDSLLYNTNWKISVKNPNILSVKEVKFFNFSIDTDTIIHDHDTIIVIDTILALESISPKYFNDSLIYFETDSVPDFIDTIIANYVSYSPSTVSDTFEWAYAGMGLANLADEENGEAAVFLGALLKYDSTFTFPHYPYTNYNNLYGALAYAFFRIGLYANCVDVLKEAGWDNPPEDPFIQIIFLLSLSKFKI